VQTALDQIPAVTREGSEGSRQTESLIQPCPSFLLGLPPRPPEGRANIWMRFLQPVEPRRTIRPVQGGPDLTCQGEVEAQMPGLDPLLLSTLRQSGLRVLSHRLEEAEAWLGDRA